jgi:hypothetical protein
MYGTGKWALQNCGSVAATVTRAGCHSGYGWHPQWLWVAATGAQRKWLGETACQFLPMDGTHSGYGWQPQWLWVAATVAMGGSHWSAAQVAG